MLAKRTASIPPTTHLVLPAYGNYAHTSTGATEKRYDAPTLSMENRKYFELLLEINAHFHNEHFLSYPDPAKNLFQYIWDLYQDSGYPLLHEKDKCENLGKLYFVALLVLEISFLQQGAYCDKQNKVVNSIVTLPCLQKITSSVIDNLFFDRASVDEKLNHINNLILETYLEEHCPSITQYLKRTLINPTEDFKKHFINTFNVSVRNEVLKNPNYEFALEQLGFTRIPSLLKSLISWDLSGVKGLPPLQRLSLANNNIIRISIPHGLNYLNFLNLSGNKLTVFPAALRTLPNLENLDLLDINVLHAPEALRSWMENEKIKITIGEKCNLVFEDEFTLTVGKRTKARCG